MSDMNLEFSRAKVLEKLSQIVLVSVEAWMGMTVYETAVVSKAR